MRNAWPPRPKSAGVDGVVCGHIHHAEIRMIGDVLYLNDGDWVEAAAPLSKMPAVHMEILRWALPSQTSTAMDETGRTDAGQPAPALIPA